MLPKFSQHGGFSFKAPEVHLRHIPFLQRLGEYSLLVFLVNAIVRDQFLSRAVSPASQLLWACISAGVSFLIAAIIQEWLLPKPAPARQMQAV